MVSCAACTLEHQTTGAGYWHLQGVDRTVGDRECCVHICMQVLTKAVKPPTPDAARLAAVVSQQQLAMQHVRMHLARMVKQAYPAQVNADQLICTMPVQSAGLQQCETWALCIGAGSCAVEPCAYV